MLHLLQLTIVLLHLIPGLGLKKVLPLPLGFCYDYKQQKIYYLERSSLKLHLKVDSECVF